MDLSRNHQILNAMQMTRHVMKWPCRLQSKCDKDHVMMISSPPHHACGQCNALTSAAFSTLAASALARADLR